MIQRWSERRKNQLAVAVVAAALLLPVRGLMRYQGPPMEEGFMLAFAEQLLHGRYPHRDFLHLYGPASLWLLAGVFKVFGTLLQVERTVGLLQHTVVAFATFALLRPWGRKIAVAGAVAGVVILIGPLGLSAMAWNGALAAALCGLAIGVRATTRRHALLAGGLAAVALLFRPDLVIAVAVSFGAVWWRTSPDLRRRMLVGWGAVSSLWVVHLLLAGPVAAVQGMFIEPVFKLRGGRSLPIPPSWGELDGYLQRAGGVRVLLWPFSPDLIAPQVAAWFWLVLFTTVALVWAGWWCGRVQSPRAHVLRPMAWFSAALVTQAVQRPDTAHLSWVTGVSFAVSIAALAEVFAVRGRPALRWRSVAAAAPVAFVLVAVIPFYPVRTYVDVAGQSFGYHAFGFPIRRGDRTFYYGDASLAAQAQVVVDRLAQERRPGQRLIVGPFDLAQTPYSDAFFYYLFPELVPGTRYIEMDPGIADAADSGLADELRRSDWLIQSDVWSGWDEPNDSRNRGSEEPNRVVARDYCEVLTSGKFRLMRRCDNGNP